jgi:hypothetical protein
MPIGRAGRRIGIAGWRGRGGLVVRRGMPSAIGEHGFLAGFSVAYYAAFVALGVAQDRPQLPFYALFMALAAALVVAINQRFGLGAGVLWGLSVWGFAHMAGGLLVVDGRVLYRLQLIPVLLRYDQVVHAFGFGFATLACHAVLSRPPGVHPVPTVLVALCGMGVGAVNEMLEFLITRVQPDSNVGGFVNTGWDLVFNALGCGVAALWIKRWRGRRRPRAEPSTGRVC